MKAATRIKYGSPDQIKVIEIPKPIPKADELLIRNYASTVNRTDCGVLTGLPYVFRLFIGFPRPKSILLGTDFAGIVEEIGKNVTQFKVGDKVWGFNDEGLQTHAQYFCCSIKESILKITNDLSFSEAVACAEGAHYAYNFLNKVKMSPGQKVLVNGGTGAIGSAAIQFLKYKEMHVTATCGTQHIDAVKALGADVVIDYQQFDFTKLEAQFSFVFDAVGKSTFSKCKPLLLKKGIYISSELGPNAQNIFYALLTPIFGRKKVIFPLPININRSMKFVQELLLHHKFKPLLDKTFILDNIADAYRYTASGQKIGNVIVKIQ